MSKGYVVAQKWSPSRRKMINLWEVRRLGSNRLVHTSRSYMGAVKLLRRKVRR